VTEEAWWHHVMGEHNFNMDCRCQYCKPRNETRRKFINTLDGETEMVPQEMLHTSWTGEAIGCLADPPNCEPVSPIEVEATWKCECGYGEACEETGAERYLNQRLDNPEYREAYEKAKRDIVTSDTGGKKGTKSARFDLIDQRFLWALAEVCGFGAGIYGDNNWRRGYDWSLSYAALMRHLSAFLQGEDLDPDSGLPHVSHVAWHAMVLFVFSSVEKAEEYGRFDTREEMG